MQTLASMLRSSPWASTLAPAALDAVLAECFERQLPAGALAIRCGDPALHWVGVIEGLVKMSVSLPDGRVSTFTGVMAGGWAGEGTLLRRGPDPRWRYDGVAVRPTRLACMPRHTFERLVAGSMGFNHFLLQQLNARLSLFVGLVEGGRLLGPDARVARCLASLFDPDLHPSPGGLDGAGRPGALCVQLSQDEIGLLAGVSRQRAHRALHALERAGLLRVEFGGVTVLDLQALRTHTDAGPAQRPLLPSSASAAPPRQGSHRRMA